MLDLLAALKVPGSAAAGALPRDRLAWFSAAQHDGLRDPAARIPAVVMTNLLAAAERRTGDPLIGVHVGECAEPRGALAYLVLSSPHLGDALRTASRLGLLILDSLKVDLVPGRDTASLTFDVGDAFLAQTHHVIDYLVMVAVRALRRAHGPDFDLREVHFRHLEPDGCAGMTARAFVCTVRFGRRQTKLVFAAGSLRAASRMANPSIAEQIEKFAACARRAGWRSPFRSANGWPGRCVRCWHTGSGPMARRSRGNCT